MTITWAFDDAFLAAYPDAYSQYLVRESFSEWEYSASNAARGAAALGLWPDSYYRLIPFNNSVIDLRSVIGHEIGHSLAFQHPDASYFNPNPATGLPEFRNYETTSNGVAEVPTYGGEMMNEGYSDTPGVKGERGIDERDLHRVPSFDEVHGLEYSYPDTVRFVQIADAATADIVVSAYNSPGGSALGNGGVVRSEPIETSDPTKGTRVLAGIAEVNAGYPISFATRRQAFSFINEGAFAVESISIRTLGTSTREPFDANTSGRFRFQRGVRELRDPADLESTTWEFSQPRTGSLPVGGRTDFVLELDVPDWEVTSAFGRYSNGDVFGVPIVDVRALPPEDVFETPGSLPSVIPAGIVSARPRPLPQGNPDPTAIVDRPEPLLPAGVLVLTAPDFPVVLDSVEVVRVSGQDVLNGLDFSAEDFDAEIQQGRLVGEFRFEQELEARQSLTIQLGTDREVPSRFDSLDHVVAFVEMNASMLREGDLLALRVTTHSDVGSATTLEVLGKTQGVVTFDARCGLYGTVESCCPDASEAIELSSSPDFYVLRTADGCVAAGDGSDHVVAPDLGLGFERVALGGGDDVFFAKGHGSFRIIGGTGNDRISATWADVLVADGNDGADLLLGGPGDDRLTGGEGDDVLKGGLGNDLLEGGPGDDLLSGGPGDDILRPGQGRDWVWGGAGDDRVELRRCDLAPGTVIVGGSGEDTLAFSGSWYDLLASGVVVVGFESFVPGLSDGIDSCI